METKFCKALTLRVPNFIQDSSQRKYPPFSSGGGCEWIVTVNLKGSTVDNYLSLYLSVNEPKSLGLNWKRKIRFYFVLLNQSGQETYRTPESNDKLFSCSDLLSYSGWTKAIPLEKILDKSVLVNDSFVIEIYIKVVEVVDGNAYVNGFHVLSSQVPSVKQIFKEHPDFAKGFKSKNQVVKTEYMNVLLNLLETVKKPLKRISETELSKVHRELCELTEVGFKLKWLKKKLEEIKKANTEGFQIQQLEKHVKNLELNVSSLKVELDKEKVKSSSLGKTLSDLKTELTNEKAKSANFLSLKKAFSDLRVELEKEKAKSTKALSLKETWSGLKIKKDHKKGNSSITDNLLSWEDADLVSPTKCLGNGYKIIN